MAVLDTAHETWNKIWTSQEGHQEWSNAEPEVVAAGQAVRSAGGTKALDVGAGLGRHALALARMGFSVEAIDASQNAVSQIASASQQQGLQINVMQGRMDTLPYADGTFDFVVSFNVIYHGDREIAQRAIDEMRRVTKPGGQIYLTMLSKRNKHFGHGEEIAPGTFVVAGAADDKIHPHFYCSGAELVFMLDGFEIVTLVDREQKPSHWHWHVLAERI